MNWLPPIKEMCLESQLAVSSNNNNSDNLSRSELECHGKKNILLGVLKHDRKPPINHLAGNKVAEYFLRLSKSQEQSQNNQFVDLFSLYREVADEDLCV